MHAAYKFPLFPLEHTLTDGPIMAGERWCVVTGGRGFAARHLVEMLLRSEEWSVRIADLGPSITLDPSEEYGAVGLALPSGRAAYVSADLRNKSQVIKAFEGAEVVFHMAAPDSSINSYKLHYSVNVEGTKNVIDACVECKVKRLIYTSSASVVFDCVRGTNNADESMPYTNKFNDSYAETKAEGEKLVIKANGRNGLLTCCLRPSSIFGPGDKLFVPSLVSAARAGKSKYIIGGGNNMYDFTHVENVAYGHICAERTLASGGVNAKKAGGQAYFITNMEPIKFWDFLSLIVEGLGYERPRTKIPVFLVMPIAHVVEWTYKMLSRYGMPVSQLTPSRIRLLTCNMTFSCSKAKDQLDYEPLVPLKDGLKRTITSYHHLRAQQRSRTSKASIYPGSGSRYTIIMAMAMLLSLAALLLFIHNMLPPKILGYRIEKIPPSYFQSSEGKAHLLCSSVTSSWNSAVGILKSLCKGKDWLLFQVAAILLVLNFLGAMSLKSIYKIGVPVIFVAAFAYKKWEDEIDGLFNRAFYYILKLKSEAAQKFSMP